MTFIVQHCADSFKYLQELDGDRCVDVMLTDPPYTAHVQDNLCSGSLVGKKSVQKYTLPFAPLADHEWIFDAVRVTRRWVVTFCANESLGLFQQAAPHAYVRGGVWYRSNSMGQLTKDRPATAYEGLAILHGRKEDGHPKKRWNGHGSYGIWRCNGTRGKKGRHPNEKPTELACKLVALFSDRGETVFDPFCGSGAIGEACVRLGRYYIGLDQDPVWVAKAAARLAGPLAPMTDEEALALCGMPKVRETEVAA